MKNITLTADEALIEAARAKAQREKTTLNAEFRRWLLGYTGHGQRAERAAAVIDRVSGYVRTGGLKLSREEMNER